MSPLCSVCEFRWMRIRGGFRGRRKQSTLQLTYASRDRRERKELTTGFSTRGYTPRGSPRVGLPLASCISTPSRHQPSPLGTRFGVSTWTHLGNRGDALSPFMAAGEPMKTWAKVVSAMSYIILGSDNDSGGGGADQINFGRRLASRGRR